MTNKLVVIINSLKYQKWKKFTIWNEIFRTKLQLPPEPLTRGLPPPDPRSLCPQLNLLNPSPARKKIPGYATASDEWKTDASSKAVTCFSLMCLWSTQNECHTIGTDIVQTIVAPRSGRNCDPRRQKVARLLLPESGDGRLECLLPAGIGQKESGLVMWATSRKDLSSVGLKCFQYLTFFFFRKFRSLFGAVLCPRRWKALLFFV